MYIDTNMAKVIVFWQRGESYVVRVVVAKVIVPKNRQIFIKTWSRWRFYASGVRAIDFSHQNYPHRGHFQKKIEKKFSRKKFTFNGVADPQ